MGNIDPPTPLGLFLLAEMVNQLTNQLAGWLDKGHIDKLIRLMGLID